MEIKMKETISQNITPLFTTETCVHVISMILCRTYVTKLQIYVTSILQRSGHLRCEGALIHKIPDT